MTILFLVVGGNLLLFYGLFTLLNRTVFKKPDTQEKPELEREFKEIQRELRML